MINNFINNLNGDEIAIIGMAGRFPGADKIDSFWRNLCEGVESISFFTNEELISAGVNSELLSDRNYVKASGVIENIELFDAAFFGFSPREAEITDPQHRLFIECVWQALENAGYNSENYNGQIGLFAGVAASTYLLANLYSNQDLMESVDSYQILIGNDKDFLPTQISYKLNLKGPSINVQTACSTSLVAVHLACQSLMNGESDIALAGGVSVTVPQKNGYRYQQGGIHSPDGHCRAFDAQAQGTIGGNGLGVVVLKRLEDAIADGDYIHAVIKGSAVNNDGSLKIGYTAPSVDGQRKVILEALALARVEPETITYIEAHGTGTQLGDPIEIKALTEAFRTSTHKKGFCAIGSVKTNVGHLNTAAGVTGLIKTALALKHKQIPASLHFQEPNSQIDFANSPFYVNTKLSEWQTNGTPRRAGVSSFGIGGTNAHVILEEAPAIEKQRSRGAGEQGSRGAEEQGRKYYVLILSAKTESALETATQNLSQHLTLHPNINLADVAYTLQVGRRAFDHRRIILCHHQEDAVQALTSLDPQRVLTDYHKPSHCPVIFMFSGQGSQYANMAKELYDSEPTFKQHIDTCAVLLQPHLGIDIRSLLYSDVEDIETAAWQLQQTAFTQSALFVIEYALAQLFLEWGIHPQAMIGHSIGEYVAATIAGVFSLEDALLIVAKRGQLMQQLPPGSMLAIPLSADKVQLLLDGQSLEIATINSPSSVVVSGTHEAVAALQEKLSAQGIECRLLHTSHAFHSQMMQPILEEFGQWVGKLKLNPPRIRFISNVTGSWITDEQATNPSYWSQHLRQTVRFSDGISQLIQQFEGVFLEVGPGRTLSTFAKQNLERSARQQVLTSLRHVKDQVSDSHFLLQALGRLWLAGVEIDWSGFYTHEQRHRLPLPTYPFERQRYWIEPKKQVKDNNITPISRDKKPDIADWFYIPYWKPSLPPVQQKLAPQQSCLVFLDQCGLGTKLVEKLKKQNLDVITVQIGENFTVIGESQYIINPQDDRNRNLLIEQLFAQNKLPKKIVHLWNVTTSIDQNLEQAQTRGFYSLLFLAQTLGKLETANDFQITVISNNLQPVTGTEALCPEKATLLGPVKVISQEYANIKCRSIDVSFPLSSSWQEEKLVENLLAELTVYDNEKFIAYRGLNRWVQSFEPVRFDKTQIDKPRLREKGVYLITGGLGGIGLVLAEYLAQTVQAKLILLGRSAFPKKNEWEQWLATHDEADSTSYKIRKVQELENLGAEVLVMSADASNIQQMQGAIARALQQFGQLNGVIHAAGVPGGGVIQRKTQAEAESILAPKVQGTIVLDAIVKDIPLDFFVLISSKNSILGGFGQVDYCGANAFLDAFAHYNTSNKDIFTTSINWDTWQEVGMAVNTEISQQLQTLRTENLQQGILPHEGVDAFARTLGSTMTQVVVSASDLYSLIKEYNSYNEIQVLEILDTANQSKTQYPRPKLNNDYVAPRNEIEKQLVNIWQQILGVEQIGIYDNFFELGGDSLIGIQLIAKLNKTFNLNISVAKLYECPNISSMSKIFASEESQENIFEQRLSRGQRRRQTKMQTR